MTMIKAERTILVEPTSAELGYLGGLMDGEGCFQVSVKSNSFGLQISMTDRCVIDWLLARFGGNYSRAGITKGHKRVHKWYLARQADLLYLLPQLIPHLVLKAGQAEQMLELVRHLQSRPTWDVPTSRSPKAVRPIRRRLLDDWKARELELRQAVRDARPQPELVLC